MHEWCSDCVSGLIPINILVSPKTWNVIDIEIRKISVFLCGWTNGAITYRHYSVKYIKKISSLDCALCILTGSNNKQTRKQSGYATYRYNALTSLAWISHIKRVHGSYTENCINTVCSTACSHQQQIIIKTQHHWLWGSEPPRISLTKAQW